MNSIPFIQEDIRTRAQDNWHGGFFPTCNCCGFVNVGIISCQPKFSMSIYHLFFIVEIFSVHST